MSQQPSLRIFSFHLYLAFSNDIKYKKKITKNVLQILINVSANLETGFNEASFKSLHGKKVFYAWLRSKNQNIINLRVPQTPQILITTLTLHIVFFFIWHVP